ncbi:hypothetical protein EV356DRAFT_498963 [Viridothelium virens]|uniref:Uncharacterized protein n=1 Tax=Viridothelium virens TaxID=1048519 RepID=A0A6A6HF13_VIRVR|nr:hypothetical protein EV356DRAFT_498963 [Viridothelium virens]
MDNYEVSGKGTMHAPQAINYFLTGHHIRDQNRDLVLLAKKEDGSFYLHRKCGTSEATRRDTVDAFKHADHLIPEGAFAAQIKQLDGTYEAINKTLLPGLKSHGRPGRKLASQKRSEETLDRGDISLISILEWYNRESALEEGWRRLPIYSERPLISSIRTPCSTRSPQPILNSPFPTSISTCHARIHPIPLFSRIHSKPTPNTHQHALPLPPHCTISLIMTNFSSLLVPERDAQRGAHLDFLRRTEGFILFPRPPQYPHYPIPPSVPTYWDFAQHPAAERAVAGETFWPRSEMGGRTGGRRRKRRRGEVQAVLRGEDI